MTSGPLGILRGRYVIRGADPRFMKIFSLALRRPPDTVAPVTTVRLVVLSRRETRHMVGLTTYSGPPFKRFRSKPSQKITFYSGLLGALSDSAAEGVIAHELAHAWLNEHVRPEESRERESKADALAKRWGFGPELEALNEEAETVLSP